MDFIEFPKIPRLSREVVVTEKIDGTNAQINILELATDDPTLLTEEQSKLLIAAKGPEVTGAGWRYIFAGSRSRWITRKADNYGFANWVAENADTLWQLGPGSHFGEWWGKGIQRNYSMTEKRFSLFNVHRWGETRPACCHVVPTLYKGPLEEHGIMKGVKNALSRLQNEGSVAAPGFMNPEGIVVFHAQAKVLFKKTLEKDEEPKGLSKAA